MAIDGKLEPSPSRGGESVLLGRSRTKALVLVATLLVSASVGGAVASLVQLGCGTEKLVGAAASTRLVCVSVFRRGDDGFLLLRNYPDRVGDDVTDAEAASAVGAVTPYLPASLRGICYLRRGIDREPVCISRVPESGKKLQTVADDRHPYLLGIGVGVLLGALLNWMAWSYRRVRQRR